MNLSEYLLEKNAFTLKADLSSWEEAVQECTNILEHLGAAEPRYYDEIIKETKEIGFYFLIGPGIAMPHARPECGALNDGFALVTLKSPVPLGDEEADLFLAFSATSAEVQNTKMILQIATLLSTDSVDKIREAKNTAELREALMQVSYEEE